MKEKYYQNLDKEESALKSRRNNLIRRRFFIDNCDKSWSASAIDAMLRIISEKEGKEYGLYDFAFCIPQHYETEWRSPLEGTPNVCGAELAATSKPYDVLVPEKIYTTRIITDKDSYELFSSLSFSQYADYKKSLETFMKGKKYVSLNQGLTPQFLGEVFPYLTWFLERLVEWRLEHNIMNIPKEVISEFEALALNPDIKQLTKEPNSGN